MTNLAPLTQFVGEELPEYVDSKENPEEWYVLIGKPVGEYTIWADEELPEGYEEHQANAPSEEQDANPNVGGFMQIGSTGWMAECFDFSEMDGGFVSEAHFGEKIDRRLMDLLVVHESVLTEAAKAVARDEKEPEEVTA